MSSSAVGTKRSRSGSSGSYVMSIKSSSSSNSSPQPIRTYKFGDYTMSVKRNNSGKFTRTISDKNGGKISLSKLPSPIYQGLINSVLRRASPNKKKYEEFDALVFANIAKDWSIQEVIDQMCSQSYSIRQKTCRNRAFWNLWVNEQTNHQLLTKLRVFFLGNATYIPLSLRKDKKSLLDDEYVKTLDSICKYLAQHVKVQKVYPFDETAHLLTVHTPIDYYYREVKLSKSVLFVKHFPKSYFKPIKDEDWTSRHINALRNKVYKIFTLRSAEKIKDLLRNIFDNSHLEGFLYIGDDKEEYDKENL